MKFFTIKNGFIIAGLVNIAGILSFTRAFTHNAIMEADPIAMSKFGLMIIMLWGLASIAMANVYPRANTMVGVLAIEKLIYVINWGLWITSNNLDTIYSSDFFAGVYYTIYGPMDFAFLVFYSWVFLSHKKQVNA